MLFRLIATVVLALGVTGIVILLNRFVFRGTLPRWVLPASIAASILALEIAAQYDWYPRTKAAGGDKIIVVREFADQDFWRPWSYIWPTVFKFTVVDGENLVLLENSENIYGATMVTYNYYGESSYAYFAFDCSLGEFGPYSSDLNAVEWGVMEPDMQEKICVQ